MLTLSPLFPAFVLLVENPICFEQNWDQVWNGLDSLGCSSPVETELRNRGSSDATSSDPPLCYKKPNHNACERDRRQKLNGLYSTLRSLLPNTDQKKKLSIPATISQALKYIPQLQNQVERMLQRKEDILRISNQTQRNSGDRGGQSLPTVSTSQINDGEIVIQVCVSKINNRCPFSAVLQTLEEDELLQVINASAFASCENKVVYTLHVQAKGAQRVECERLSKMISSLC